MLSGPSGQCGDRHPQPSPEVSKGMKEVVTSLSHAVTWLTGWLATHSVRGLRLSLGGVFLWFGVLKFFPDLSPAQAIALRTLERLTWGTLSPSVALHLLALWETLVGVGLLLGVYPRVVLALLFLHMVGTFSPLVLFPDAMFLHRPYAPTLEAQYILKNFVFISAGIVIGATTREGAGRANSADRMCNTMQSPILSERL